MKTRQTFVSNSSSSSFICDVCGEEACGMDISLRDWDMSECENGHYFCNSHSPQLENKSEDDLRRLLKAKIQSDKYQTKEEKEEEISGLADMDVDELSEVFDDRFDDGLPTDFCPICTFKNLSDSDGYSYIKKKYGVTDKDILKEVKNTFHEYSDFSKYIN